MGNIILIPTSHVAKESLEKIEKVVKREKPDCIAVELDEKRFFAMQGNTASNFMILRNLGIMTFLIYFILKKLQNWVGKIVGIFPGSEMLYALRLAKENKIKAAFIDADITLTLMKIKKISTREKLSFISFVLKGLTSFLFFKIRKTSHETIDLQKVPGKDIIDQAMNVLKEQFPQLYNILVHERNIVMSENIKQLSVQFEKIVAVIGAGHHDGIKEMLTKHVPKQAENTFSITYQYL